MSAVVGTSRIAAAFASAKAASKCAFVPYITAGFPGRADTVPVLLGMQAGGADVIELGVPFSDPLADGSTIQEANEAAVAAGITVADCIAFVGAARAAGLTVPVVMMGYYNPFMQYGEARLAADCAAAGVDGFIVVDLPPEAAGTFRAATETHALAMVPLVAPTTTDARMCQIAAIASGYVYCVSVTGVTGQRSELPPDLASFIGRCRAAFAVPLAVGFGLSTNAHVKTVGTMADGAVMGSRVVRTAGAAGTGNAAKAVEEMCREVTA
jgi:tryptophan synthase